MSRSEGHDQVNDRNGATARPSRASTVYIETYGCQMNVYDTQVILDRLASAGFTPIDDHLAADLVIVNTCSVREHAERRVLSRLAQLRRLRAQAGLPRALLGICGCMAERMQESLADHPVRPDLVVGVDRYDELPALLASLPRQRAPDGGLVLAVGHDEQVHYVAPPEAFPNNNSHLVTIHKGCDYRCTYCIVPYTRGPQREKRPEDILAEIGTIVDAGGEEATLLGQNVTAYRWRDALDFAGLLELILRETDLRRLRFLTGHPCDMHPHLMDLIGDQPRICPWLHIPAQSGSDRILRRMNRRYTRDRYLDMVAYARRRIPQVTFSSDVIVGFPAETQDDFAATLELLRLVRFDSVFAFKYSPRPKAPSVKLADDVPLQVKKQRLGEVLTLQAQIWSDLAASLVGQTWTAIVETPARRPEGHWRLRTLNNRKIVAPVRGGQAGQIRDILITGYQNTTFLGMEAGLDH
jgi:tRNA-2-methylthio-N6-dimethylallyladenosine synthase